MNNSLVLHPLDNNLIQGVSDYIAGLSKTVWQTIAAASLVSYQKLLADRKAGHAEISKILHIAGKNKSSSQLLSAVAEYLDSQFGYGDVS